MQLGMIGLGRMGGNMAKRIAAAGHEVVGFDRSPESDRTVSSLEEMVAALKTPRLVWVMVPAGEPTDSTINELAELLEPSDMIIDGGNSRYTDDARHAAELEPKGIHFMDCGVSGGVWGINLGYALMVGGNKDDFTQAGRRFRPGVGRPGGRRPLRQDGAQRHRIRYDAGLRRGLRHHGEV